MLVGRASPGPMGGYVVAVGYLVSGTPGAIVGWLAMITPAVLVVPLLTTVRRWLHMTRVKSLVDAVVITGAALLMPAGVQLARDGLVQLWKLL